MKKLVLFIVTGFLMRAADASEIVRSHVIKNVDFETATFVCEKDGQDFYLKISIDDMTLWASRGLALPERKCYGTKFKIEDILKRSSVQPVEISRIEITGTECDRNRVCYPTQSGYQTRLAAEIDGIKLNGYQEDKVIKTSEPTHRSSHEGCTWMGALAGGWEC